MLTVIIKSKIDLTQNISRTFKIFVTSVNFNFSSQDSNSLAPTRTKAKIMSKIHMKEPINYWIYNTVYQITVQTKQFKWGHCK